MVEEQHAQTLQATLQVQEVFVHQINTAIIALTTHIEILLNVMQPPPCHVGEAECGEATDYAGRTSDGFRSGQNRDPTGYRPTFIGSSVGSVWIWRYPIDSPVTTSVGPKKQSVDAGSRS